MFKFKKKPENKPKEFDTSAVGRIINESTHFSVLEAYKVARTNLMFTLAEEKGCKRVLITSAGAGEGKSTSAVNLAITFAQTGVRVLLVEADLRRPKLHRYLSIPNKTGVSECLGGFNKVDEVIQHVERYNIDCIPGGSIPPNPAELLMSSAMKNMLDELSDKYDYIFIDSPPVNVVTDSAALTSLVSGVLVVVKQNQTREDSVAYAISNLEFSNAKILGYLLNGYQTTGHKIGHYNYRHNAYAYRYQYKTTGEDLTKEA